MKSYNKQFSQNNNSYEEAIGKLNAGSLWLDLSNIHLTSSQLNDLVGIIENNPFIGHIVWGTFPDRAKQLVERIEQKLVQNNKTYKPHPTDFVHGLLSSHAYQDPTERNVEVKFNNPDKQHYNKYLKDWRIHKIFDDEVSSYYGAIYVNDQTKQIVLAHRGTKIEGETTLRKLTGLVTRSDSDLQTDIIGVFGKNIVAQQITAYVAAEEACSYAKDHD